MSVAIDAQVFSFQCQNVESYPEFPGGDKSLVYYLRDTLQNILNRKGISAVGLMEVHAVIFETGKLGNVHAHGAIHPEVDAEVINLINNMPRWAPAINNGKPVQCNVNFNIDVSGNFAMNAKKLMGIEITVIPENKDQAAPLTLSRLAGVMQDFLLQRLPQKVTDSSFNGTVEVRFGMYPDGWVGRVKVLKGENKKLEDAVAAAINSFNSELAENKINFKDELMKTFIAKVSSNK
jgi:hypothetical protein